MGNFSKNPDTVRDDALAKGYDRVLFQQGKPVLDRELNLLADLVSPQRLIEHHIGNGVPDGGDGFRITGLDAAQNDFTISAGRCLVGGYEVVLSDATTYKTQPYNDNVAPLPAGTSNVYLHVFTNEVDHTEDSDLNNTGTSANPDVGFETAVRRKVEWEVRVETGIQSGADYFLLAVITKSPPTVTDRRRIGLTMASIRDEVTTARGSLASLDARLDVSLNENGTLANGATVTGDLIVDNKLGIGTASPANKLSVEGDSFFRTNIRTHVNSSNSPGNMQLGFSRGTGSAPTAVMNGDSIGYLEFSGYNGSSYAVGAWIAARAGENFTASASGTDLEFMTHEVGTNANLARLTIRNNGNIGVGTQTPQNKLDVEGGAVIGATYSGTNTAPVNGLLVEGNVGIGTTTPQNKLDVEGGAVIGATYSGTNAAPTNGLLVQGSVGIGTTTPQNKLDVEGGAVIGATYSGTNTAPTNGLLVEGNVGIGTLTPGDVLDVNGDMRVRGGYIKDSSGTQRISLPSGGNLDFKDAGGTSRITIADNGNLELKEDGGTSALIIDTSGKVGILTSPSDILDINGDLRVRGGNIKDSGGTIRMSLPASGNLDLKDAGGTSRITIIDNGDLVLKEDSGTAVLMIGTDGRAGINTSRKLSEFTIKGSYGWKTGTVSYTAGTVNVVGTGTSFLSEVGVGDLFHGSDQAASTRNVLAITDDTHLTVDTAFTTTQNNSSWFVRAGLFRVDDLWETPVFFISNFGRVGIGTITPGNDLLDVRGRCYSSGGWQTSPADYAEYFESADGAAIPVATPVVLTREGRVRPAKQGEVPIGITTENSAVVGNSYKEWPQKYLRDKFGRKIMEKVQEAIKVPKKKKVIRERQKVKHEKITEQVVTPEIMLENGKYIQKEKNEKKTREIEVPLFRDVDLFDSAGKNIIGKHRIPVMETVEEELDVLDETGSAVLVGSGAFITVERPKLNPKYDEKKQYIPRSERPEWTCVGLLGQLAMRKGSAVAPTWVKIKDYSDDVELWLVK